MIVRANLSALRAAAAAAARWRVWLARLYFEEDYMALVTYAHTPPPPLSPPSPRRPKMKRGPPFLALFLASAALVCRCPAAASSPALQLYPLDFPVNVTDSYRANWTSLSTYKFAGGDTGIIRFDLADLLDSGVSLGDVLGGVRKSAAAGNGANNAARVVSGSWDIMIDVQSFGSKTVSQVIAAFKVFGVYNTVTGRLVLQSVR